MKSKMTIRWLLKACSIAVVATIVATMGASAVLADEPAGGVVKSEEVKSEEQNFIKFQVTETTKLPFAGALEVTGPGYKASKPLAAKPGQQIKEYVMVPAAMGRYELSLVNLDKIVLHATGEIDRVDEGVYKHQLISASADPETFVLEPRDEAIEVAIGYVEGYLAAELLLDGAAAGELVVGVDRNADSVIDAGESVRVATQGKTRVTAQLPANSLPLVSKYDVRFVGPDVSAPPLASNYGDYDFLNKEAIAGKQDASAPAVRELTVAFVRKPVATRVTILNASLFQPPAIVKVEPQKQEETRMIIRKGDVESPQGAGPLAPAEPVKVVEVLSPKGNNPTLLNGLARYWWLILLGGGAAVGLILLVKSVMSSQRTTQPA